MSQPSPPSCSFDPAVVAALHALVTAQAPPNRPMTLAEVEQAVFDLLQALGPRVTEEVLATQIARAEKRGAGRRAAGSRCAGSGSGPARC
jgi:hypothetical protein